MILLLKLSYLQFLKAFACLKIDNSLDKIVIDTLILECILLIEHHFDILLNLWLISFFKIMI